jgi:hypothetical protein
MKLLMRILYYVVRKAGTGGLIIIPEPDSIYNL